MDPRQLTSYFEGLSVMGALGTVLSCPSLGSATELQQNIFIPLSQLCQVHLRLPNYHF